MQSLHAKFANLMESMSKSQRDQFYERKIRGMSIEAQLNLCERVLGKQARTQVESIRESAPKIIRNNGFSDPVDPKVEAARESQRNFFKRLGMKESDIDKTPGMVPKAVTEKGALAEADYEFAKRLGLSESDATKVATGGVMRKGRESRAGQLSWLKD